RLPDVCFVSWGRFPREDSHQQAVGDFAPDLAIEILSESNTKEEMRLKRQHFFAAGTLVIWEVDPVAETVTVYEPSGRGQVLTVADTLVCPGVLPGFELPLKELFGGAMMRPSTRLESSS
ncbi:MAG: Uma2 family endonuclease, partial [Gemmataceae bacterium]